MTLTEPNVEARMKILVLAYSISPVRGSEYSVAWNYLVEMSQHHQLHVLYGLAGDHMGDFDEIDVETVQAAYPSVTLVPIQPSRLCNALNYLNRKNIVPYSFYLAYRQWHKLALAKARALEAAQDFDVIHYLCPIGFREPGYLWKLDKPYLWGPIGGVVPQHLTRPTRGNWRPFVKVALKNATTWLQFRTSRRLKAALRRADLALAATSDTAAALKAVHGISCAVFAENGVKDADILPPLRPENGTSSPFKIVWIGSLNTRKSPDLLLKALTQLNDRDWQAVFIGNGPLLGGLKAIVEAHDLADRVRFTGHVPRTTIVSELPSADIHVITSMAEGNPTNLWEAMAANVPTLTLDHCGMHDTVCPRCGVKVPLGDEAQMVARIAEELRRLIDDPSALAQLKEGVFACVQDHAWSTRVRQIETFLQTAIEKHHETRY
jgi:glycosyltransferase involved in cell wall biosynthesis